jgi:hypothetical protein
MKTWPLGLAVLLASAASAQDIRLTPIVDARLRWEEVDQADIPRDAEAVTARIRSGFKADAGPFQALVEAEATLAIVEQYNSGTNGLTGFPVVVDPQNIELNRAQLRYAAHGVTATAGRQLIELADQRFVGSANFRQNQQTYDAARVQWGDPKRVFTDVTYAWGVRTVNGIDGAGARPQSIGGDNVFALAGVATPVGTLTGFAYLIDQDLAAVQGFRLENQTYGIRLAGTRRIGPVGLSYAGSYARQSDWHRNPNNYAASYWLAEATGTAGLLSLTAGHEVLGADDGRALTSVQTPLASLFKFQGWADKFTTTPPNGVRDLYGTAALAWKTLGPFAATGLSATYHRFRSDRLDQHYGTEWDLLASVKRGRTVLSARYARYRAEAFATDTDKLWLEADWVL